MKHLRANLWSIHMSHVIVHNGRYDPDDLTLVIEKHTGSPRCLCVDCYVKHQQRMSVHNLLTEETLTISMS